MHCYSKEICNGSGSCNNSTHIYYYKQLMYTYAQRASWATRNHLTTVIQSLWETSKIICRIFTGKIRIMAIEPQVRLICPQNIIFKCCIHRTSYIPFSDLDSNCQLSDGILHKWDGRQMKTMSSKCFSFVKVINLLIFTMISTLQFPILAGSRVKCICKTKTCTRVRLSTLNYEPGTRHSNCRNRTN